MARLLVMKARNKSAKEMDIVAIKDDGWEWGKLEGPPDFWRVDVPGVPAKDLDYLLKSGKDKFGVTVKFIYQLDQNKLSSGVKNVLHDNGRVSMNLKALKEIIAKKD